VSRTDGGAANRRSPLFDWWPVRLEALATLRGLGAGGAASFRETILRILSDPLQTGPRRRWALNYADNLN
jgi:hypothetical protein